jgi:regulatory protein
VVHTITKLERQKRHPKRLSVFLDGEFAFGADEEVVAQLGLAVDQRVEPETICKAIEREEEHKVREKALRFLSFRNRSVKELKTFLLGKGYDPDVVTRTLTRLEEVGLLDDRAFAKAWVEGRAKFKGMGERLLEQELRLKGVKKEIISEAVKGLGDEGERALSLSQAKVERMKCLDKETVKRRLVGFLQRRGFPGEIVYEVIQKVLESKL